MLILCAGLFFDAYDAFALSIALPELIAKWGISKIQAGYLGSAGFSGMLVGALVGGYVADRIGRVKVFITSTFIYSFSMGLCVLSNGFNSLFVLRVVAGVGLGAIIPVATAYLVEFMPVKVRGRALSIFNANYSLGVAFAFLIGYALVAPFGWKWAFAVGAVPIILCLFAGIFMPESVRYLLQKNRVREAAKTVDKIEKQLLKRTTVPFDDAVKIEEETLSGVKAVQVPISRLFARDVIKSTLLMSTMWFCLSFATFSIMVWMPVLLTSELKYDLGKGLLWLAFAQLIGAAATPVTGFAADYIGRKKAYLFFS